MFIFVIIPSRFVQDCYIDDQILTFFNFCKFKNLSIQVRGNNISITPKTLINFRMKDFYLGKNIGNVLEINVVHLQTTLGENN